MAKDQKPDQQNPDEAAMEEHVRQLMDIKVPDPPSSSDVAPASEATPASSDKPTKRAITVTNHDETTSPITVADVATESPDEPGAASPEPTAPPLATKKRITISHHTSEPSEPAMASTPQPIKKISVTSHDTTEALPLPETPLIPTDKLTQAMEPAAKPVTKKAGKKPHSSAKASTKKTTSTRAKTAKRQAISVTEPVADQLQPLAPGTTIELSPSKESRSIAVDTVDDSEVPENLPATGQTTNEGEAVAIEVTDTSEPADQSSATAEEDNLTEQPPADLDREIAEAFASDTDELDELAAEQLPSEDPSLPTTPTAPEIPSTATEEVKPKFDKFKPLTTIRPQLPPGDKKRLPIKLDDAATGQAVDDIVVTEAERLLSLSDAIPAPQAIQPKPQVKAKLRPRSIAFWRSKTFRKMAIGLLIVALLAAVAIPTSRATAFNALGLRTSASVSVLDKSTGQPLKDVSVTINGTSAMTDSAGTASLTHLKLGAATVAFERRAFASASLTSRLDWRANKLPTISLVPTGNQHSLTVTDYLTGKPIKASLDSTYGSAQANSDGIIKLTTDKSLTKPFTATLSAVGYRSQQLTIDPTQADAGTASLVIARKYVYLNRQDGTLNVYRSDFDGQNQQLVLKGSGNEQPKDTVLIASSSDNEAALVSARSNNKASDGSPLTSLTLLNLNDGTTSTLVQSAQLQLIGWVGDRLIYSQIANDSKSTAADRQQLVSYDFKTKQSRQLATANYFNDVLAAGGKIYYAPSSAYQPASSVGFFGINADGSGKSEILSLETWNVYRTSFSHLSLSVQQDWYDFKLGDQLASKQSNAPSILDNLLYLESPDGQHGLRVQGTSGQTNLLVYDKNTGKESNLISEAGLSYPLRWLNNTTLVYRINTAQETADYAYSLDGGGTPKKIHDVTDISGLTAWQIH